MNSSSTSMLQKEDTSKHPLRRLSDQPQKKEKKWMQTAGEEMKAKGTEGKFSALAARRGMGTQEAASKLYNAPGEAGKEARFAYIAKHKHGK